jgi:hypothetical protein
MEVATFPGRFVRVEAGRHGARVLETGIVRDHVHVVLDLSPTFEVPRLLQGLLQDAIGAEPGLHPTVDNRERHPLPFVP